ncbi:MAG: DUF1837 domain-containing protein [Litorimonas sp.]
MELTEEKLHSLVIGDPEALDVHLSEVKHEFKVDDVRIQTHCFCLTVDGNGRVQPTALAEYLRHVAVSYALPRSELREAQLRDIKHGSAAAVSRLSDKARRLFVGLKKTGEGGELILSLLAEQKLKLPQIIAKMSLKTSEGLHYNGADGVHAAIGENGKLILYWGESKVYKSVTTAIKSCFNSMAPFLIEEESASSQRTRDLELLRDHVDLNDEATQQAIRLYFDSTKRQSKMIEYRGLALVGFDVKIYGNQKTTTENLHSLASTEVKKWGRTLSQRAKKAGIDEFSIELFFLPLPSADGFRESFLSAIGKQ